jgi:beta-lactamase class A
LDGLVPELDAVPGTVSISYGRLGRPPSFAYRADQPHYAASMMKVAVLAALHRAVAAGRLDLADQVEVVNDFTSAAPPHGTSGAARRFGCERRHDSDELVWERLGQTATLDWLAERMIVRSSNLATNLILARVGLPEVAAVWAAVGATGSVVTRGIGDTAASGAGLANLVTAADLAALFDAIGTHRLGSPLTCQRMLETLLRQEHRDDLAAGLPPGVPVAHKSGWIMGVRHSAAIVYPPHAEPFVLAICTTTPWATNQQTDKACQLVAHIATTAYPSPPIMNSTSS